MPASCRLDLAEESTHLAVEAFGLGSQHNTIHIEEPFKKVLGVPPLLTFNLIMPIGYPDVPAKPGVRRPLDDMMHREMYDMTKYMSNKDALRYLYTLREKTVPVYRNSYIGGADNPES